MFSSPEQAKSRVVIRRARLISPSEGFGVPAARGAARRGDALERLAILPEGDLLIEVGRIARIEPRLPTSLDSGATVIEATGRVVMPGFVDAHTHLCWAGDRLDEWARKLAGATYQEILAAGGGIFSTVRAVRAASIESLRDQLLARLRIAIAHGTTSIEIKSGYGLSTEAELKMLDAIALAAQRWPGHISPTALLGHVIDADVNDFVHRTIHETLPIVSRQYPGITLDAFCETGAWSLDQSTRLFEAALRLGHPVRVHADQFNSLGMVRRAIALGVRSVDHLEVTTTADLKVLAESSTFGVMLPICGMHLDGRYANGRGFVDAGGALAIATNANPGSAPCFSMPMAIASAVRHLKLTPAEAIAASTANPAALLRLPDRGTLEIGKRADVLVLHHQDERALAYEFGHNPVATVICGGQLIDPSGVLTTG
jgi:imidazolonepropionase